MNKLNIAAAYKSAWRLTKEHFIVSAGLILAYLAISFFLGLFVSYDATGVFIYLLSIAVTLIWQLGIIRISIDAVDGEAPRFGAFQESLPRMLNFIIFNIITLAFYVISSVIIILVGALSCNIPLTTLASASVEAMATIYMWIIIAFIPLIYISIRLFFAPYLLVDRNMGAIEAIKMSWKATETMQGKIFLFILFNLLFCILGIICFVVGIFVTYMLLIYASASLYRQVFPSGIQDPLLTEDANVVIE